MSNAISYSDVAISYSDVITLLPNKPQHSTKNQNTRRQYTCAITSMVLGIIICLGAAYLVLAAYQILPQGINVIGDLNMWGQLAGYGGLGLGSLIFLIGWVKCHGDKKHNHKLKATIRYSTAIQYDGELTRLKSSLRGKLQPNEVLVVDDKALTTLFFYYLVWDPNIKNFDIEEDRIGYTTSAENGFKRWCLTQEDAETKTFLTYNSLKVRL